MHATVYKGKSKKYATNKERGENVQGDTHKSI